MNGKKLTNRLLEMIEERRHDQLATYVGLGIRSHTYEEASELPLAVLEHMFAEDDFEHYDGADLEEAFEQDEGYIKALHDVLGLLGVEVLA